MGRYSVNGFKKFGILGLLVLVTFSACILPCVGYDWTMFKGGPDRSGETPDKPPLNNVLEWSFKSGNDVESSPAVVDGMVFFGSNDAKVYALNQSTGEEIWSYSGTEAFATSPAVVDGMVFIASINDRVYALDQYTGTYIWDYATSFDIRSSPCVAGGLVFVGSFDDNFYAINQTDGSLEWFYPTGDDVSSSPAVADGMVFFGSANRRVYALNQSTGAYIWDYLTGNFVVSSPAVVNGVVYIGSHDYNLYALNQTTGALIWSSPTSGVITSSPAVYGDYVFVGSHDTDVYAFYVENGSLVWNYDTGGLIHSSPAIAGDMVFIGSDDDHVYAFDVHTGVVKWKYKTQGDIYVSSPAIADGMLYIGSRDDFLYAIGSLMSKILDVHVDVGSIHFRGEIAEFYMSISLDGYPLNASIKQATLYYSNGTTSTDLTLQTSCIDTGLYRIPYTIPIDAPLGTYTLSVEANYTTDVITANGFTIACFQLSKTLDGWDAWLIQVSNGIAIIQTDTQIIKTNLTTIDATITSIQGNIVTIETDIGTIKTGISAIGDELAGWHVTSLDLVSGATTFELYALTTSSLDDASITDSVLTLVVSGVEGSSGVTHVVVPKTLLSNLESSLDQIVVTLDGEEVAFVTSEDKQAYTLTISYTHSTREIKVYLEGLTIVDLTLILILSTAVTVVVVLGVAFYMLKFRRKS